MSDSALSQAQAWLLFFVLAVFFGLFAMVALSPWAYWTQRARSTATEVRRAWRVDAIAGLEAWVFTMVLWLVWLWRQKPGDYYTRPGWACEWQRALVARHARRVRTRHDSASGVENHGKVSEQVSRQAKKGDS